MDDNEGFRKIAEYLRVEADTDFVGLCMKSFKIYPSPGSRGFAELCLNHRLWIEDSIFLMSILTFTRIFYSLEKFPLNSPEDPVLEKSYGSLVDGWETLIAWLSRFRDMEDRTTGWERFPPVLWAASLELFIRVGTLTPQIQQTGLKLLTSSTTFNLVADILTQTDPRTGLYRCFMHPVKSRCPIPSMLAVYLASPEGWEAFRTNLSAASPKRRRAIILSLAHRPTSIVTVTIDAVNPVQLKIETLHIMLHLYHKLMNDPKIGTLLLRHRFFYHFTNSLWTLRTTVPQFTGDDWSHILPMISAIAMLTSRYYFKKDEGLAQAIEGRILHLSLASLAENGRRGTSELDIHSTLPLFAARLLLTSPRITRMLVAERFQDSLFKFAQERQGVQSMVTKRAIEALGRELLVSGEWSRRWWM